MWCDKWFYPTDLLPAAPVANGYKNVWIRDLFYVGLCSDEKTKRRIWKGMLSILDNPDHLRKLKIHSKQPPIHWFEYLHIRYNPDGKEIWHEHWLHNQWESIGNWLIVALEEERLDLAKLLIDYLCTVQYWKRPAAGAWEDRNSCDSYSLAACIYALQKAKVFFPEQRKNIEQMIKMGCKRLYTVLLPYATIDKKVCLSLLGVIWPFDMAGPYKQEIIDIVKSDLMREPFGFIRYKGDHYSGDGFDRCESGCGNKPEVPWLLGDLFMCKIEPDNVKWSDRVAAAHKHFGFMPEAFYPENMKANGNSPLLWAEAMYHSL